MFFEVSATGLSNEAFLAALSARGIRMGAARGQIRAVTHLDVREKDIDASIAAVADIAASPARGAGQRSAGRPG